MPQRTDLAAVAFDLHPWAALSVALLEPMSRRRIGDLAHASASAAADDRREGANRNGGECVSFWEFACELGIRFAIAYFLGVAKFDDNGKCIGPWWAL